MRFCGVMIDSARCLEGRAYYRRLISFLAERGVDTLQWHFTDDQGCTLQFDSVPGIGSPNAYSKSEMRELIAFARGLGVTILPELASLGHSRYITRLPQFKHLDEAEALFTGICPVAPETRALFADLLEETIELFDSPVIHVGLDEANIGHHPLTQQALRDRPLGQIVADHISFLHERIARRGRRMMMWGDGLLKDRSIAPQISRDILIADWQYGEKVDGQSTQYFLDEGFDVVLCPALVSHGQTLFPGDQLSLANLRSTLPQLSRAGRGQILGLIDTVWQPERYMHGAHWMPLDLAVRTMKDGAEVSVREVTARFANDFYGFTPSSQWLDRVQEMYRLSPLRSEWLALLKMQPSEPRDRGAIEQRAQAWTQIAKTLAVASDQVCRERESYQALCLTAELMAHLCRKAQLLSLESISSFTASQMIAEERRLVRAVDDTWNLERFADDPGKHAAIHSFFRDNNLLANLQAHCATTVERLSKKVAPKISVASAAPLFGQPAVLAPVAK